MKENLPILEFCFRKGNGDWSNPELLQSLKSLVDAGPEELQSSEQWLLARWNQRCEQDSPLTLILEVPQNVYQTRDAQAFLASVESQTVRALGQFSNERGWPIPEVALKTRQAPSEVWGYQITSPRAAPQFGVIEPNKILAIGEPKHLSGLLGLETLDPVFGLTAKWIGRSQLDSVCVDNITVFDGPGVVAAHALHHAASNFSTLLTTRAIVCWLQATLNEHPNLVTPFLTEHLGTLLGVLESLLAEDLWLPTPTRFLEDLTRGFASLPSSRRTTSALGEVLRKSLVAENLSRWLLESHVLEAIEWKPGKDKDVEQPQQHNRRLLRLGKALKSLGAGGAPEAHVILLTTAEERRSLSEIFRRSFPALQVLSWEEIPSFVEVHLSAVIDAELLIDASPWEHAYFELELGGWPETLSN